MKRLLKIAAVTIAVIIAILITVMILAVLLFPKERVITIIEQQASVALGMPVEVGDAGISFLGIPALRVNDTILGPPPGATEPLAVLPSVRVEVNILKLLKREIEIVAVEFSRPEISFTVSARETATESRTTGAPSTGGAPPIPFPLTMNMLSVRNGRITIDQIAPGSRVVFEDVNQRLTLSISPDLSGLDARGMVSSGNIAFSSAALDEPVSGIAAAFEFLVNGDVGAGNLTIDRGDLRLNDLTVSVKGSLEEWERAFFSLSTGEVDARGVLELIPGSILPLKELITADGTFSLEIDGGIDTSTPVPAVRFTGDLDIGHMRLGVRGFPRRIDDISARIAFTEKNISIDRFLVSTGSTAVNLNGIITSYLTSPEVKLGFGGILEIGDFTGALPILSENNVHGQIDFDLGVEGHGYDPITYEPSGTMTLRGLSFDLPGVLRNACALNGVIMVTPGTLTLDDLGIRSGKSDFEFAGSLVGWMSLVMPHSGERAVFTSTLSSTLIDLGDLLVIDETKEPEIIMPWEMKDAIEAMPIPPNLNAGMDVALGRVTFGRLTADSVKGVLTLSDGAFRLSGLSVGAYQGTLTGDASFDASNRTEPVYSAEFKLEDFESGAFIADLFNTGRFFRGNLNVTINLAGAGLDSVSVVNNLTGNGMMRFESGEIDNWEFTRQLGEHLTFLDFDTLAFNTIENTFSIEDRLVSTPDMRLVMGSGDISLNGSTGFDQSIDYTLTLSLDRETSQRAVESISSLANIAPGNVPPLELVVRAGGTLTSPTFGIDTSRAEQQLREQVKERVKSEAEQFIQKQLEDQDLQERGREIIEQLFR